MTPPSDNNAPDASTSPSFSVVLFDLDDTLFAHRESVVSGIRAHRRSIGGAIAAADDAEEAMRWNLLEEHHYHRYLAGELTFAEQRRERARGFVEVYGEVLSDHEADAWFDTYFLEYVRAWTLHDDALACLDALTSAHSGTHSGTRIGIITNGELDFQTRKLDAVGLNSRVENVVASGAVGFTKPDARIFAHACALFGVETSAAVYVGDRLRTDAIGAATAGLTGVWLDRPGTASADELAEAAASGVVVIRSLAELPAALARVIAA